MSTPLWGWLLRGYKSSGHPCFLFLAFIFLPFGWVGSGEDFSVWFNQPQAICPAPRRWARLALKQCLSAHHNAVHQPPLPLTLQSCFLLDIISTLNFHEICLPPQLPWERKTYAKQGCLSLIIPYSQYQQWQSAHRRKDPNHYVA